MRWKPLTAKDTKQTKPRAMRLITTWIEAQHQNNTKTTSWRERGKRLFMTHLEPNNWHYNKLTMEGKGAFTWYESTGLPHITFKCTTWNFEQNSTSGLVPEDTCMAGFRHPQYWKNSFEAKCRRDPWRKYRQCCWFFGVHIMFLDTESAPK